MIALRLPIESAPILRVKVILMIYRAKRTLHRGFSCYDEMLRFLIYTVKTTPYFRYGGETQGRPVI